MQSECNLRILLQHGNNVEYFMCNMMSPGISHTLCSVVGFSLGGCVFGGVTFRANPHMLLVEVRSENTLEHRKTHTCP